MQQISQNLNKFLNAKTGTLLYYLYLESLDHFYSKMTENQKNKWKSIIDLVSEIKHCDDNDITTAAFAMSYICIDTLANLSRPAGKIKATRIDFINWVDKYLKADANQPYSYRGKDVYAARCGLIHTYSAEAELHNQDLDTIIYAYHNGGQHKYDPNIEPRLVLIASKSFINDIIIGIESFLNECQKDQQLRLMIESRLDKVFQITPIS